jgi:hypothetical protein
VIGEIECADAVVEEGSLGSASRAAKVVQCDAVRGVRAAKGPCRDVTIRTAAVSATNSSRSPTCSVSSSLHVFLPQRTPTVRLRSRRHMAVARAIHRRPPGHENVKTGFSSYPRSRKPGHVTPPLRRPATLCSALIERRPAARAPVAPGACRWRRRRDTPGRPTQSSPRSLPCAAPADGRRSADRRVPPGRARKADHRQ